MSLKTIYQYLERTIPAGDIAEISAYGRFITLLSNSGASNVRMSISGQSEQEFPQGISVELPEDGMFTLLRFHNSSAASITIAFAISAGRIYDNRVVISGSLATNPTSDTLESPAALAVTTAAGVVGTPDLVADSSVRERILQNNGANPVWVGDVNVDGANNRGIKIDVNDTIVLANSDDVWLRSTGGNSTISVINMKK